MKRYCTRDTPKKELWTFPGLTQASAVGRERKPVYRGGLHYFQILLYAYKGKARRIGRVEQMRIGHGLQIKRVILFDGCTSSAE